jgi:putative membrane protein
MTVSNRSFEHDAALPISLLLCLAGVAAWSWIGPYDRLTWWLESIPALIALPLLVITYRRFRFTNLAYILIALHASILLIGGHYTYERVPLFNWIRDHFHLMRNDYDKLGHFAQGFIPAIVAREVLLRRGVVKGRKWLVFIVISICMAISAGYELLEWAAALIERNGADAFLGTQGDPWDTQSDMFCALIGAAVAQLLLVRVHDVQIERLGRDNLVSTRAKAGEEIGTR